MELKEYQQQALATVKRYLEFLSEWRAKAESAPDLEIDFPAKAWQKAEILRPYTSRTNGIREPLPNFCLKIPTGGGKTFLAVKAIDLVNTQYLKRRTGLVLWIVPTTQIYRQTIRSLHDRDHPYRQHLDLASGGRTVIREKSDRFSPQDVSENLVVLMLMLPSANRQTKETLRVFKDSGGFQDFFPAEEDVDGQKALLKRVPNLDTFESASGFWGRQIKTSLGNSLRTRSPLIILDEGHKAYSEGAQATLRGFNPCLIVELSATPTKESNLLVEISGAALNREEMIKLDLHLTNRASTDWKDTLLAAHNKVEALTAKAHEYEASTGSHIRPICLIQAERTGSEQRGGKFIHSEDVRDHLVKTLGIPPEEIAVKTAEKDELKAFDDTGGLMTRDCRIRYIITKQALQEGWDCAFAYVLAILTNPGSKNALTQLVGRILRQPFARKTRVKELDESYVFCFQQKAGVLIEAIRTGFQKEGLGDLRGQIVADEEEAGEEGIEAVGIRERFLAAAQRTVLPVFVVREGRSWRPVNYDMDIASEVKWSEVDLGPVYSLTPSMHEEKDIEQVLSPSQDGKEVLQQKEVIALAEGGIRLDPVFMARQLYDLVPNPWQAHEFADRVLTRLTKEWGTHLVANNFVFIIGEARKQIEAEKDRLAEGVFTQMLGAGHLRFLLIGRDFDFSFPEKLAIQKSAKKLTREDGRQLELSLFTLVPEDQFNETEKAVAWYLEGQERLFFWYRNRVRHDYAVQGWRRHRIYPDFIFTASDAAGHKDYQRVYVVETKGMHLSGSEDTGYKRKVLDLCNREAKRKDWNQFAPGMKDKVLRFEVIDEKEWQRKLNELLAAEVSPQDSPSQ